MNPDRKERIHSLLRAFLPALTQAQQYTTSHRLAASSIENTFNQVTEALSKDRTLPIVIVDDRVIVDEEPLEDSIYINRFIHFFKSRGIQHVLFRQGITLEELKSFIAMLTAGPVATGMMEAFPHIQFGKVGLGHKTGEEADQKTDEEEKCEVDKEAESKAGGETEDKPQQGVRYFDAIVQKDLNLMEGVYFAVTRNRGLPNLEINQAVSDIITAIKKGSSVLVTFSPLRELDEYTFTHSTNVCILTLAQAIALNIEGELLHDIGVAAMLHDIGKIFVPDEILNKKGSLTETEWMMIRQHPLKGAEYLIDKPGIPPLAVVVAYEHHMFYDLSGYPKISKNWRQNICSQMTTISDYFDALRTKRIYRDSVEMKTIADQMAKMEGVTLNPVLTKNFLILIKKLIEAQKV